MNNTDSNLNDYINCYTKYNWNQDLFYGPLEEMYNKEEAEMIETIAEEVVSTALKARLYAKDSEPTIYAIYAKALDDQNPKVPTILSCFQKAQITAKFYMTKLIEVVAKKNNTKDNDVSTVAQCLFFGIKPALKYAYKNMINDQITDTPLNPLTPMIPLKPLANDVETPKTKDEKLAIPNAIPNSYSIRLKKILNENLPNETVQEIINNPYVDPWFTYDDPRISKIKKHAEELNEKDMNLKIAMFDNFVQTYASLEWQQKWQLAKGSNLSWDEEKMLMMEIINSINIDAKDSNDEEDVEELKEGDKKEYISGVKHDTDAAYNGHNIKGYTIFQLNQRDEISQKKINPWEGIDF